MAQSTNKMLKLRDRGFWHFISGEHVHDTIVGYCGALSRKGTKPVMLDPGAYLR